MTAGKRFLSYTNRLLRHLNLRLGTLTAHDGEQGRLDQLKDSGHFSRRVFPILESFQSMEETSLLEELDQYQPRFNDFTDTSRNDVGYTFDNGFFGSPDAEVAYTVVRKYQPATIIEVGSGNSTKVLRQAAIDEGLNTHLVCIDPSPRVEINDIANEFRRNPVEADRGTELFRSLGDRDILFIDSSHKIRTANDVVFLYLDVIPQLAPGTLIHIHDIFLPYDYPSTWVVDTEFETTDNWRSNEQYLVQALLMFTDVFEVLWAGRFLQHTRKEFSNHFPHLNGKLAQSLWLRKIK